MPLDLLDEPFMALLGPAVPRITVIRNSGLPNEWLREPFGTFKSAGPRITYHTRRRRIILISRSMHHILHGLY